MGKFITKEQADKIKEKLYDRIKYFEEDLEKNVGMKRVYVLPIDVENILYEVTEKPFPEFKFVDSCGDKLSISYDELGERVRVTGRGQQVWVPLESFHTIAEGVNKIANWIKEQEQA